jgi:acetyl esterase/lipase
MRREPLAALPLVLAALTLVCPTRAAEEPSFTRTEDVIYGRKYGTALTLDVVTPKRNANGAAVVFVVSGGFFSAHDNIQPARFQVLLDRGYTVFAVVHGSQPRYQVTEIVQDLHRAVRFIRSHAQEYRIDPNRIGVVGASAGGHLSLMLATAGAKGDPNARDPVDQASSRVQAVACFFPATDFLNYGSKGKELLRPTDHRLPFRSAFDYHEPNRATGLWERITDAEKLRAIAWSVSPIYHVQPGAPPTLILHGDQDDLVPLQQSESFVAKLQEAGVEAKLVVKKGAGHGWSDIGKDVGQFADWFDQHLGKGVGKPQPRP